MIKKMLRIRHWPVGFAILTCVAAIFILRTVNPRYELTNVTVLPYSKLEKEQLTEWKERGDSFAPRPYPTIILEYSFDYSRGQNQRVIVTPPEFMPPHIPTYVEGIWIQTQADSHLRHTQKINMNPFVHEALVDLSGGVREGKNTLIMKVKTDAPWARSFFVYPALSLAHGMPLVALGLLVAAASMLLYSFTRFMCLDAWCFLTLLAGMLYYIKWFLWPTLAYTRDIPGHLSYIYYMATSPWMNPYEYKGHEDFHPFLYYFLTGRIFSLFYGSILSPLTAIRLASLASYIVFAAYGVKLINENITGWLRYLCAGLLVFWPVAVLRATNINNDIVVNMLWSISFYYLANWHSQGQMASYQKALIAAGVLFMVKSNAWVMLGILGLCSLYGLLSKRLTIAKLLRHESLLAFGMLVTGIIVNMGRYIYLWVAYGVNHTDNYFGMARNDIFTLPYFLSFDVISFVQRPFVHLQGEIDFWGYFLKSALYSETSGWGARVDKVFFHFPQIINALLVAMIVIWLAGLVAALLRKTSKLDELMPYLIAIFISILASMMFTYVDRYMFCQNFRYVMPMLVPFIVLYGKSLQALKQGLTVWLYWLGCAVAVALPFMSTALFLAQ